MRWDGTTTTTTVDDDDGGRWVGDGTVCGDDTARRATTTTDVTANAARRRVDRGRGRSTADRLWITRPRGLEGARADARGRATDARALDVSRDA